MNQFLINGIGLITACSGGGSTVSSPLETTGQSPITNTGQMQLWGLWHCSMQPGSDTIDITPLRSAMFTANVNNLLEGVPVVFSGTPSAGMP